MGLPCLWWELGLHSKKRGLENTRHRGRRTGDTGKGVGWGSGDDVETEMGRKAGREWGGVRVRGEGNPRGREQGKQDREGNGG